MRMGVDVFFTTVGDLRFLIPALESYAQTTRHMAKRPRLRFLLDGASLHDGSVETAFLHWVVFHELEYLVDYTGDGINHLWCECVRRSARDGSKYCVVLNDDVYLTPGWLDMILRVLSMNSDIGIVGIPCDDAVFFADGREEIREKWLRGDYSIFHDDFARYRETPVKRESHTSGICWACRPQQWIDAGCEKIAELEWAYGEYVMADKLRVAGLDAASIYVPCIYHYGGGGNESGVSKLRKDDASLFASWYGTGHLHELNHRWNREHPEAERKPIVL